jgi:membrane-bound lytic murein transglycosylase A
VNDRPGPGSPLPTLARRTSNTRYAAVALAYLARARKLDRSYVFFRVRNDSAEGPPGALGVPLTAGRSIAVDPRVTPLGAPVFIEAARGDDEVPLRRLVMAQDTGGAIRGAVRADFFWGSGPAAGVQALQTRDPLAMWVLLPKGYLESRVSTRRTRSIGPGSVECTAPDSDYCDD